jgi:hypothetical protein
LKANLPRFTESCVKGCDDEPMAGVPVALGTRDRTAFSVVVVTTHVIHDCALCTGSLSATALISIRKNAAR